MRTSIRIKVTILHQIYIIWSIIDNRIVQCGSLERDIKLHILSLQTRKQEQQKKKKQMLLISLRFVCLYKEKKKSANVQEKNAETSFRHFNTESDNYQTQRHKNAHYTYMQRSRIFRSRRDFLTNTNTNPLQKPCNGSNIPKQTCKISQQTSENNGTSDRKCPDMFAKISAHVTPTEKKGSKT